MKIVIIGGGIAGIYALKKLKEKIKDADYFIINDKNYFLFTPKLVDILIDSKIEKSTIFPLENLSNEKTKVIINKVNSVNLSEKKIYTDNEEIDFDILIFAQGAKTNFFGIENLEKYSIHYKNYEDLNNIKDKIQKLSDGSKISIIGGGPTGTELAFSISNKLKNEFKNKKIEISIYQSGETLIPTFDEKLIKKSHSNSEKIGINLKTNSRVLNIDENKIFLKDGSVEESDMIIWATGIISNKIETYPEIDLKNESIPVKETLQIKDFDNVFAIGDCNFLTDKDGKSYPPTAQVAVQQSEHVALNIFKFLKNETLEDFKYKHKGEMVFFGTDNTSAKIKGISVNGFLASIIRDVFYKKLFNEMKNSSK